MGPREQRGGTEKRVIIKTINIQGLTKPKGKEIEELVGNNCILCITETQKKIRDVNFQETFKVIENMRDKKDRKGGGVMLIYRENNGIELNKMETKGKDLLYVSGSIGQWKLKIIVVYFSVNDSVRNEKMKCEIEKIIEESDEPLIVTGDFNGHVGFKGKQTVNKNGNIILEWMEKYRLIMLNDDEKCTGEYTWSREGQRSVIDYFLVTNSTYKRFHSMRIDEEKEIFDLSDHNLMEAEFKTTDERKEYKVKEWVERKYYKTDRRSLDKFRQSLEDSVNRTRVDGLEELELRMKEVADKVLERTYRKREVKHGEGEEPIWINEELRCYC